MSKVYPVLLAVDLERAFGLCLVNPTQAVF